MRLALFCESQADARIASDLTDRVMREEGPDWIADLVDTYPSAVREWLTDGGGHSHFDIHQVSKYVGELGARVPQGHFNGAPGAAGALAARTAFFLIRHLVKRGHTVDAVLLVWDMDAQGTSRRAGLDQARTEAERWAPFAIVLGRPNAMREAWVLAGFQPRSEEERDLLDRLRRELGFSPTDESHALTASDEAAKRSAKRVLSVLTRGEVERELECWARTPLADLRARGEGCGLRAFLDELSDRIVPLARRPPAPSSP